LGKVISIISNKGGTGKTTLVSNYASILAEKNPKKKILMIDTDSQGNLSMSFGLVPNTFTKTVKGVFTGDLMFKDIVKPTKVKNLFICPSNRELGTLVIELLMSNSKTNYLYDMLRKPIEDIRKKYDYILIDTPPSLELITANVLNVTDSIIIPVTMDEYSRHGLGEVIHAVNEFNKGIRPRNPIEVLGVVRSHVKKGTQAESKSSQEIMKICYEAKIKCFDTVIYDSVRFMDTVREEGVPAVLFKKKKMNETVKGYYELWEEIGL
jgi:chromosome partitioning protein